MPGCCQQGRALRSLYFFHSNNDRNLFRTTFDEATVKECYRREQSIVPQQALALTNSRLVLDAAARIAERLSMTATTTATAESSIPDDITFIRQAFTVLLGITASEAEVTASHKALQAWRKLPDNAGKDARAHLIWALLNHNDFVTLR